MNGAGFAVLFWSSVVVATLVWVYLVAILLGEFDVPSRWLT